MKPVFFLSAVTSGLLIGGMLILAAASTTAMPAAKVPGRDGAAIISGRRGSSSLSAPDPGGTAT